MATRTLRRRNLIEDTRSTGRLKVDRVAKVIHDVKILGFDSLNGRAYEPAAVREAADLYEGIKINLNHHKTDPDAARDVNDRFGWLENVHFVEGDGLRGDLHYLIEDNFTRKLLEAAERRSDCFGLSHNAVGDGVTTRDGIFRVHKIVKVRSVDIVSDPATTKSLTEGRQMARTKTKTKADLLEEENLKANLEEAEDEDSEDTEKKKNLEEETEPDRKAAILAILNGMEDNETKAQKLDDLCASLESMAQAEDEEEDPEEDPEEEEVVPPKKVEEGKAPKNLPAGQQNLTEQAVAAQKEVQIWRMAAKKKMTLTEGEIALCMAVKGKTLVESQLSLIAKARENTDGKPRSGVQLREEVDADKGPDLADADELATFYRSR